MLPTDTRYWQKRLARFTTAEIQTFTQLPAKTIRRVRAGVAPRVKQAHAEQYEAFIAFHEQRRQQTPCLYAGCTAEIDRAHPLDLGLCTAHADRAVRILSRPTDRTDWDDLVCPYDSVDPTDYWIDWLTNHCPVTYTEVSRRTGLARDSIARIAAGRRGRLQASTLAALEDMAGGLSV